MQTTIEAENKAQANKAFKTALHSMHCSDSQPRALLAVACRLTCRYI